MIDWQTLQEQTMVYRRAIAELLASEAERADIIPPTWRNNLRWHAGHLLLTPRLLTFGLAGEPIGVPGEYRAWFGKGSSPADWDGASIPPFEQLVSELLEQTPEIFAAFEARPDMAFTRPYTTLIGAVLHTPAEALAFSTTHDALHLGLIWALRRGLNEIAA